MLRHNVDTPLVVSDMRFTDLPDVQSKSNLVAPVRDVVIGFRIEGQAPAGSPDRDRPVVAPH